MKDIAAHPYFVADHSRERPTRLEDDGAPTWITRGSNFVVAITRVGAGTVLSVDAAVDEYFVLLPDVGVDVHGPDGVVPEAGNALLIVPPGPSRVTATGPGLVIRCFTCRESIAAEADNAADFATPRPDVAPLVNWPEPIGGFRLRAYPLDRYLSEGDKTRVFRSASMMINILRERTEPRDVRALSPHSHVDFEQGSIAVRGTHVHHMRYPWTPDMTTWQEDRAVEVGSPSVMVIPPTVVHTTRNVGSSPALLVDVFAPPRVDFSRRPAMVRNADEYPMPKELDA